MKIFRFGRILKNLRKDHGDTQADLAKYLGISRSAISMYESGEREPDFETLEAIADYFNVNMDFLLGQTEDPYDYENDPNNRLGDVPLELLHEWEKEGLSFKEMVQRNEAYHQACEIDQAKESTRVYSVGVKIPVLGHVVAGIPIEAIQEILDYEEIDEALASTGDFFALRVVGVSMEPRIREGDVVIVRKQPDVDSGDTAIVLVNGDEATVKKVKKLPDGIMLIANNPEVYEPKFYNRQQIEELPVVVLGKVVELRAKF